MKLKLDSTRELLGLIIQALKEQGYEVKHPQGDLLEDNKRVFDFMVGYINGSLVNMGIQVDQNVFEKFIKEKE